VFYELGVTSAAEPELSNSGATVRWGVRVRKELLRLKFSQKYFCAALWPPWSLISLSAVDGDFVSNRVD